jgi:trimeric autotransporter adhesin
VRFFIPALLLLVAALDPIVPNAQTVPGCLIGGTITSTRMPLPGVVVTVVDPDNHPVDVAASAEDGAYALKIPAPGRYVLKAELVAFAPIVRELTVDQANCQQRIDLTMTLASRAPAVAAAPAPASTASPSTAPIASPGSTAAPAAPGVPARAAGARANGGRGAGAGARGQQFQSLALLADDSGAAASDANGAEDAAAQLLLPPGFSPETSAESVTAIGTAQPNDVFSGPNGGDVAARLANAFGGGDALGQGTAGGGPGAGRGGFGGPGGPGGPFGGGGLFAGRGGRGGRGNQIRGSIYQSFDSSALDAAPFALNGQPTVKPDYFQDRFGVTVGGPLVIPKVINSPRTFFFLNYTGNHSHNPFDAYSTVPTEAERAGDLSAVGKTILDPKTGQPFGGNQIPIARIDPAASALLGLFPLPNQGGDVQNFHTVTTTTNDLDDVNVRLVHTFGAAPQRQRGGGGGGRGGGGRGRAGVSNLNVTIHFRRSDITNANAFPTLGGATKLNAWDIPVGYSFTKAGFFQSLRFDFNRQHSESQNLFAFSQNIAGDAGLQNVAPDPFDWGAPNLSFGGTLAGLHDMNPSARTDRTIAFGDTIVKTRGRHTTRFGGDYRDIRTDSRTDANARGSFVFSGLYTGLDFSDFLLGLPQQATVQYGPGEEQFRSTSWDLFLQDDWRVSDKVTVNAGLRYEYFSPVAEADNKLSTLDVAPGFTAVQQVIAGGSGPYSGAFDDTIVRPFRGGLAPRIGIAWRPMQGTVIRTGYGINYNSSVYQNIATQLAGQPPFATTNTVLTTASNPLPLEKVLAAATPLSTTNTYAVDPDYRLGFVQIWNLDLQRDLTRTVQMGVGYTGTKGADLDILRAPNRGPDGLLVPGVPAFLFESAGADSILQSVTFRLRRRLTNGLGAGVTYTLSKSIDDASSIAGGAGVVAQNDRDLQAERGLSTFDQRHRVSGDFTFELPFGEKKKWFESGAAAQWLGNWQLNGSIQLASGTPFTARVVGATTDVAGGVNGTLRANYNGAPIAIPDPTTTAFFNTAAFSVPAPGTFGDAGRDTIIGPGTSVMNLGLTKNITFGTTRGLSIQLLANNVFNTVQFASIDTVVNSRTFGYVTGVRPMRRLQLMIRFRF